MSVLRYFNFSNQADEPIKEDFIMKSQVQADGSLQPSLTKVDYKAIQAENGKVSDWSIPNLLRAGINPKGIGTIHTSEPTRSEGYDNVKSILQDIPEDISSLK